MFSSPGRLQTEKEEELSGGGEGTDVQGNKFRLQQTSAWGSIAGWIYPIQDHRLNGLEDPDLDWSKHIQRNPTRAANTIGPGERRGRLLY